ncbi:hypothetical protein HDU96_007408 [Phlyctochytrium bullatum]|nr:hypothetical protein HDU96_007408 [Phlyctochytrium bullatum]
MLRGWRKSLGGLLGVATDRDDAEDEEQEDEEEEEDDEEGGESAVDVDDSRDFDSGPDEPQESRQLYGRPTVSGLRPAAQSGMVRSSMSSYSPYSSPKRLPARRFAATNRQYGSPYARPAKGPLLTSTPINLRKKAVMASSARRAGPAMSTPYKADSGEGNSLFGFLKALASPAISLLQSVSPKKSEEDDEFEENEQEGDELPKEIDEEEIDDRMEDVEVEEEVDELDADDSADFQEAVSSNDPKVEKDNDVIVVDDEPQSVSAAAPVSSPPGKFINKNLFVRPATPAPSKIASLPKALDKAPFGAAPQFPASSRAGAASSSDAKSTSPVRSIFKKPSPKGAIAGSAFTSAFAEPKPVSRQSNVSVFASAPSPTSEKPSLKPSSSGFSFLSNASSAAPPAFGSGFTFGGTTPAPRNPEPQEDRVYQEFMRFLQKKAVSLSSEETEQLHRIVSSGAPRSSNSSVTPFPASAARSVAMSVSDLAPAPRPVTKTFSKPLFMPVQTPMPPAPANTSSVFGRTGPMAPPTPAVGPSGFTPGVSTSSLSSTFKGNRSSLASAVRERARRRQLQYFGASLGPTASARKKLSSTGQTDGDVGLAKTVTKSEPSAKRVRTNEVKDDTAAKLILGTLEDMAPPPTSLLPTLTEKVTPINPYEKDVFAPINIHPIPKLPSLPKVHTIIKEVKASIAPPESKSVLLKAKLSDASNSDEKAGHGTPARPLEKNTGFVGSSANKDAQKASTEPTTSIFPLMSKTINFGSAVSHVSPAKPPADSGSKQESAFKPFAQPTQTLSLPSNGPAADAAKEDSRPVWERLGPKQPEVPVEKKEAPAPPKFSFSINAPVFVPKGVPEIPKASETEFKFDMPTIPALSLALKQIESDIDSKPLPTFDFTKPSTGASSFGSSTEKSFETPKFTTAAPAQEKPFAFPSASSGSSFSWGAPKENSPSANASSVATTSAPPPAFSFSWPSSTQPTAMTTEASKNTPAAANREASPPKTTKIIPGFTPVFAFPGQKTEPAKEAVAPAAADATPPSITAPSPLTTKTGAPAVFKFDWSAAGAKPPAPAGWSCDACLLSNKADATACVACGTKRPGAQDADTAKPSEAAPNKADEASESKPKPFTGFNWAAAGTKPANTGNWSCNTCLSSNKEDASACAACQTPKPGAEAPAKTTAPSAFSFGASTATTETKPADAPAAAPAPTKFNWGAAGSKPPSDASKKWQCSTCLLQNDVSAKVCSACSTPNPDSKSDAKDSQEKTAAAPAPFQFKPPTQPVSFGSESSLTASKPTFSFGAAASTTATPSAPTGFVFNPPSQPAAAPSPFTFGQAAGNTQSSPFGSASGATPAAGPFTFGATSTFGSSTASNSTTSGFGAPASGTSSTFSGFSFLNKSNSTSTEPAPAPAPLFGAASSANASKSSGSEISFSFLNAKKPEPGATSLNPNAPAFTPSGTGLTPAFSFSSLNKSGSDSSTGSGFTVPTFGGASSGTGFTFGQAAQAQNNASNPTGTPNVGFGFGFSSQQGDSSKGS